jgi:hypothetical protein
MTDVLNRQNSTQGKLPLTHRLPDAYPLPPHAGCTVAQLHSPAHRKQSPLLPGFIASPVKMARRKTARRVPQYGSNFGFSAEKQP